MGTILKDYVKTTWKSGDIVTSEKLNNIENGLDKVANAKKGLPIYISTGTLTLDTETTGTITLDVTPNDIFDESNNVIAIPLILLPAPDGGNDVTFFIPCYFNVADLLDGHNTIMYSVHFDLSDEIELAFGATNRSDYFVAQFSNN